MSALACFLNDLGNDVRGCDVDIYFFTEDRLKEKNILVDNIDNFLLAILWNNCVYTVRFKNNKKEMPIDDSSSCIVIDPNKCILCGDCVRTCEENQGVGVLDFAFRGSKMIVSPAFGRKMKDTNCVGCGQCRVVCPTGAITIKHNINAVWEHIHNPNSRVVVQIAPAVRVAVGDSFGLPKGTNSLGVLLASSAFF